MPPARRRFQPAAASRQHGTASSRPQSAARPSTTTVSTAGTAVGSVPATSAPRPSGRAAGTARRHAQVIASPPATVAATSAAGPWPTGPVIPWVLWATEPCAWASAAIWANRVSTRAATPNGPMSERFMISSACAAGLPLPSPSARSARPSRCSPRVSSVSVAMASTAASSGPARSRWSAQTRTAAAAAPSARPTAGAQAIAAAAVCLLMLAAPPVPSRTWVPAGTPAAPSAGPVRTARPARTGTTDSRLTASLKPSQHMVAQLIKRNQSPRPNGFVIVSVSNR